MLTIYLQLCHNMLTVIQYYIIIKIKKTKASRKDLKKGKNMINQKNDLNMITRKLETELISFHFDDLEISEITTKTSWMKLYINVLFIKDNAQITKVLYKDYETGLWYYIKEETEKDVIEVKQELNAHKNFIHDCEQVHKQMKAKSNPEWHHVSLATLANIDFDIAYKLDEVRRNTIYLYTPYITAHRNRW